MPVKSQRSMNGARKVLLIGYQDQDNLGLRYLMSSVNQSGHEATIMTYEADPGPILERIRSDSPDVIGFSLIFQYMTPNFARVIQALRQSDVSLLMGVASQLAISINNAMAYEKLQSSERKYRDLVENANSIILRMDKNGKIVFFNEFAQKLFGYTEEEIIGDNAGNVIMPSSEPSRLSFIKLVDSMQKSPERPTVRESQTQTRSGEAVCPGQPHCPDR